MTQTSSLSVPLTTKGLSLQVRITGARAFLVRTWLGAQVLKLAAWVIGLELELSIGGPAEPPFRPSLALAPIRLAVSDLDRADSPMTWAEAATILVMLDGVEVKDVVAYDAAEGWVERIERNRDGEAFARDGKMATERVTGQVTASIRSFA